MSQEVAPESKKSLFRTLLGAIPTILVLLLMGGGWMTMHHINSSGHSEADAEVASEEEETPVVDILSLSEGKLRAGAFESAPIAPHAVQHVHTVPGRLRYDATKHVAVKAPIDGVLSELSVTPGDKVTEGQVLATVLSAQIGQARSEVLRRTQQLEIAQQVLDREQLVATNFKQLSAMLDDGESPESIEAAFAGKVLGEYRQEILSAYARLLLADELVENVKPLATSGSIPGRTVRERENERQLAETAFRTARDEALFAVEQTVLKASAEAAEAQRQVDLAWQSLEGLLGVKVKRADAEWNEDSLATLEIRAPFAGSIETCSFARNERVGLGDDLMILANTDSLYVEASIRESDWSAVSLEQGTLVTVKVPALNDREFEAKVHYVGSEVDSATNSVPLVATIDNQDGLFRPGMFVRVTVPIGAAREVLSVAAESVLQHENKDFVFVDLKDGRFQKVDVATGQSSEDWVEVTDGLAQGQLVVTKGAFLLKSELLLQGEE